MGHDIVLCLTDFTDCREESFLNRVHGRETPSHMVDELEIPHVFPGIDMAAENRFCGFVVGNNGKGIDLHQRIVNGAIVHLGNRFDRETQEPGGDTVLVRILFLD